MDGSQGNGTGSSNGTGSGESDRLGMIQNLAKFMAMMQQEAAGRGVPKSQQSPAQINGLNPQNPQFFGVQKKNPIPYDKILSNGNNLAAVMQGFQEIGSDSGGAMPSDAANVIAQVQRSEGLLNTAFDKHKRDSLYSGVPRDAATNLYQIELKNIRENKLYSFI